MSLVFNVLQGEEMDNSVLESRTQCSAKTLIDYALANEGAVLSDKGALVVKTGKRTGRSPKDKFIVKDHITEHKVAWDAGNQSLSPQHFTVLWGKAQSYLQDKGFVSSFQVGADAEGGINVEAITEKAWHHLFLQHLFISDSKRNITSKKTWTLISVPGLLLDPREDGVNSEAAVILNIATQQVLIIGMRYAGEMKKAMFSVLNFILPDQGVLPMHCSANVGKDGEVALFFGLSGTGKTTLSADPDRALIGDDEHGWSATGVFNFEGGCYAKCIDLTREKEPVIWDAIRYGAVVENVRLDAELKPDYHDASITENMRVAYPRAYIANKVAENSAGHPTKVCFLTCDLYGVLPPVVKLSLEQAAYYFLSGYTAKVGSTEIGTSSAIAPTFSVCFGEPFFAREPMVYAALFMQRLQETRAEVFLINTGWTGGSYHSGGQRFDLPTTRLLLNSALSGSITTYKQATVPYFNFSIPQAIEGVGAEVLDPRISRDHSNFDQDAKALAEQFIENFKRFSVSDAIRTAGPQIHG